MSARAASQMRCLSVDVMNDRLGLLAASTLQFQRMMQWLLEMAVVKRFPKQSLLMYFESCRYDETPMTVKSSGASAAALAAPESRPLLPQAALEVAGSQGVFVWTPWLGEKANTTSKASKILQVASSIGMLIKVNGDYFGLLTSPAHTLAIVEKTTAKCLQEALSRGSFASKAAAHFNSRCRLATTDKASENILCEKSIGAARIWSSTLHNSRDVHTLSRIFGQVFNEFMGPDITGMIRFSTSLSVAAQMNAFRRALREEIASRRIRLPSGVPCAEARRHRSVVLRICAGHGRNLIAKRMLLSLLPNGDWRKPEIDIYMGFGAASLDEASARKVVANGLITAMAGSMCEMYHRHRWVGADVAVDRCSFLCLVHKLGPGAYARYMGNFGGKVCAELPVQPHMARPGAAMLPLEDGEEEAEASNLADDLAAVDPALDEASSRAAFNDASRRVASTWWRGDPTANLVNTSRPGISCRNTRRWPGLTGMQPKCARS